MRVLKDCFENRLKIKQYEGTLLLEKGLVCSKTGDPPVISELQNLQNGV